MYKLDKEGNRIMLRPNKPIVPKHKNHYRVVGLLDGKGPIKDFYTSKGMRYVFDGLKLDELKISAEITSESEFDDFIKFLEVTRLCFLQDGQKK